MKKSFFKSLMVPAVALFFAACGGDVALDSAGAQKALTSAQSAQALMQTQLSAAQAGQPSQIKISGSGASTSFSGTINGPAGGSLAVSGSASVSAGSTTTDLTMTFSDWKDSNQNLTLNGPLKLHSSASASGVSTSETGDLQVSGSVNGTASFDLSVSVSGICTSTTGNISGNAISVRVGC